MSLFDSHIKNTNCERDYLKTLIFQVFSLHLEEEEEVEECQKRRDELMCFVSGQLQKEPNKLIHKHFIFRLEIHIFTKAVENLPQQKNECPPRFSVRIDRR